MANNVDFVRFFALRFNGAILTLIYRVQFLIFQTKGKELVYLVIQESKKDSNVVTFVTPNISYFTEQKYLTDAEMAFLFRLSTVLDAENCINREGNQYLTQSKLAQRLEMSRETTNRLIGALERKGLLKKETNNNANSKTAQYKVFVNPNILFYGETSCAVPLFIKHLFAEPVRNSIMDKLPFKV
ncbi:MarR family transcriptional regulator [Siminovitchia terrae]|uniref:MarR family transcriptional regulator n=1 Tax=Siminovitchia terrae TaxID=1914933 RepID=A0A429X1Q4_SIMTE|nr:MarR family transcriptional regulator [Siminovitchia terrae]